MAAGLCHIPSERQFTARLWASIRGLKITPRIITIMTLILGIGLLAYSLTLPYYKDPKYQDDLLSNEYGIDEYRQKEAEFRTNKIIIMDWGTGIAIASATIFLFLLLTKTKKVSDFKNLQTLNKATIFIGSNVAWLLLLPGTFWYYNFRLGRGDYPVFADSIGMPVMAQSMGLLLLFVPLNIFLCLTTIRINLPAKLFIRADSYNRITIMWEAFFGFWLLANLLCFINFVANGDHVAIPVNLFFTLVLLTLRAGQISRHKQIETS